MWDVRGGRAPTAQLGAYGPARHPLLSAVRLRTALAAVPGLTQQTLLPRTSLESLILDPLDPRRAAFCLNCGWQGTFFPLLYSGNCTVCFTHLKQRTFSGQLFNLLPMRYM